ncbi:MAG: flagellar hook-length control protein FliK [Acidobacteria bacterium]|nr:flagellar hook-length control protein FliK [Acidobacteriota bacterium]
MSQMLPAAAPARAASAPAPPRAAHGQTGTAGSFDAIVGALAGAAGDEHSGGPAQMDAGTPAATEAGVPPADDASSIDPAQNVPAFSAFLPFVQPADAAGWAAAFAAIAGGAPEEDAKAEGQTGIGRANDPTGADDDSSRAASAALDAAPHDQGVPVWLAPAAPAAPPPAASDGSSSDSATSGRSAMPDPAMTPGKSTPAATAHEPNVAHGAAPAALAPAAAAGQAPSSEMDPAAAARDAGPTGGAVPPRGDEYTPSAPDTAATETGQQPDPAASAQQARATARATRSTAANAALAEGDRSGQAKSASRAEALLSRVEHAAGTRGPAHAVVASAGLLSHGMASAPAVAAAAVATASSAPLPGGGTLPETTIADLVQSIRLRTLQGGGEAHIRLEPQHFGEVTISVRVEDGQVVARVVAESTAVRDWLQSNQGWLRTQLAEQQLTLDRLDVREPADAQETGSGPDGRRHQDDQRRQRRARQADTGARFEVVA